MRWRASERAQRATGVSAKWEDWRVTQDRRQRRDKHALNEDGMVLCNPRDRESAHRAEMEGIATDDQAAVTCRKCLELLYRLTKEGWERKAAPGLRSRVPAAHVASLDGKPAAWVRRYHVPAGLGRRRASRGSAPALVVFRATLPWGPQRSSRRCRSPRTSSRPSSCLRSEKVAISGPGMSHRP